MATSDLFRYATPATPGARHELAQQRQIARMLGTPNMPHQDHIARVTSEHHPDIPNQYRYPIVVLTAPRQVGKSQGLVATQIDRSLRRPRHQIYSTAQTGLAAAALWKQGILSVTDPVTATELGTQINPFLAAEVGKIGRGAGTTGLRWTNGSLIAPFAPGPKCLDSKAQVNLVIIDEAFAFDEASGSELMASAGPTQTVADWRQLWIVSAKRGKRATWLNSWLAKGRASIEDPESSIAYFEISAEPGCDPEDPQSLAFNPAIGHITSLPELWAQRPKYSLVEWKNAYLNLDAEDITTVGPLDPAVLAALGGVTPDDIPTDLASVAIAVDLAVDRSAATITAAWADPHRPGAVLTAILASGPGTAWVIDALHQLSRRNPAVILADPAGPTRSLIDDLAASTEQLQLTMTDTRRYATACQWTLDAIPAGRIHHDSDPLLTDQAEGLAVKNLGGVLAFDVYKSLGPIDALRGLALAAHHAATQPMTDQVY